MRKHWFLPQNPSDVLQTLAAQADITPALLPSSTGEDAARQRKEVEGHRDRSGACAGAGGRRRTRGCVLLGRRVAGVGGRVAVFEGSRIGRPGARTGAAGGGMKARDGKDGEHRPASEVVMHRNT